MGVGARPRRVLHVITDLDVGGAEAMLRQVASVKDSWAEETQVVSLLPGGFHAAALRAAGVPVTELDFRSPLALLPSFVTLTRLICSFRPAVVQGWMYHGDLAALLAAKASGRRGETKVVWGIRCSDMDFNRYGAVLRAVVRLCARLSASPDLVTANSSAGLKAHVNLGYHPRRTEIVHNGIDVSRFRPDAEARKAVRAELGIDENAFVAAHVARVDPMKDHASMIAAAGKLPDVQTLLIGAGTERLEVPANIHRLGRRSDIPRLLAASDAIVSSSVFGEGFSNALAEGMACGLPAIATDVGDARFIVGDTGAIVPPGNSGALASAISALALQSSDARAQLGAKARARIAEHFSLERAVKRFAEIYDGLTLNK
jgi:glycosyltransferase involved in cell wall biosynthesis